MHGFNVVGGYRLKRGAKDRFSFVRRGNDASRGACVAQLSGISLLRLAIGTLRDKRTNHFSPRQYVPELKWFDPADRYADIEKVSLQVRERFQNMPCASLGECYTLARGAPITVGNLKLSKNGVTGSYDLHSIDGPRVVPYFSWHQLAEVSVRVLRDVLTLLTIRPYHFPNLPSRTNEAFDGSEVVNDGPDGWATFSNRVSFSHDRWERTFISLNEISVQELNRGLRRQCEELDAREELIDSAEAEAIRRLEHVEERELALRVREHESNLLRQSEEQLSSRRRALEKESSALDARMAEIQNLRAHADLSEGEIRKRVQTLGLLQNTLDPIEDILKRAQRRARQVDDDDVQIFSVSRPREGRGGRNHRRRSG